MPLPALDPAGMTFYSLEEDGKVVELYLDYRDPASGANGEARTWWHPAVRVLGGMRWRPLGDRAEALKLATDRDGQDDGADSVASLEHRVRLQLVQ